MHMHMAWVAACCCLILEAPTPRVGIFFPSGESIPSSWPSCEMSLFWEAVSHNRDWDRKQPGFQMLFSPPDMKTEQLISVARMLYMYVNRLADSLIPFHRTAVLQLSLDDSPDRVHALVAWPAAGIRCPFHLGIDLFACWSDFFQNTILWCNLNHE